jgi:Transposase domain (DUF772)
MRLVTSIRDYSRERSRLEGYVPLEHPLRRVRAVIDAPLGALHQWLQVAGAPAVRCPIGPEQMVRALLLQFLFSIRRDRQLVDQIWYSMLFRWFVGVRLDDPKWELETFSTYRVQMLKQEVVHEVLMRGLTQAHKEGLMSAESLTSRRCELAQFTSDVTVGVGHFGTLPHDGHSRAPAVSPDKVDRVG